MQEFDVVIIDEATQAVEAVTHIPVTAADRPYERRRSAGYLYSKQRSSFSRATQNNFLPQSVHYLHLKTSRLEVKAA